MFIRCVVPGLWCEIDAGIGGIVGASCWFCSGGGCRCSSVPSSLLARDAFRVLLSSTVPEVHDSDGFPLRRVMVSGFPTRALVQDRFCCFPGPLERSEGVELKLGTSPKM